MERIARPDILWSVNKLARSITKWTKACDKRLNRLISYIHHTCEYKQYCHVGNTVKQCRLGLFQDSDFAGDLEDSKSTSGGTLCILGRHTFVPISWMCKKQTSVSHSSTEPEIISLDTGLRLDGLPALELWDLIVSVFGNISHISDRTVKPVNGKNKSHNKIDAMQDIDSVPSNVQSARQEALLYVFEDNEAVIKMIMKGRSSTMRHVSRTHRVAFDWLFDRINLDPKIQIKYIDTKNQLADILTKGNFTRDEWNHLLTLFNISHFSSTACIAAMAKRAQQESGEGRVTAKSRPMMNLTARTPSFVSSSASSNPVMTSHGYQDPGKSVASDDRSGKPENSSPPGYSKEDYGQSWSSKEWKSGPAEHDRSGKPETTSWNTLQKVDPHREVPLLGRNAHSARYGELIHDRTGKPETVNHQEEANQDRTGQPVILVGQSIVLGEVKAETPVHDEHPRNDQIIWQQYIQQVESLSPENRLSKICKEAGFMRVVEVGQYFVTKDTGDFKQFRSVACREYTLPRDDPASQPKGWIQGNMRIGPVLEVTTSFQHFKYGIEIRIWSVNKDSSHSCVRISYGTVKYVIDSIEDNTEIPADPQEERMPQTSTSVVAARSKAKSKPQPRVLVGTTATIPMHERRWIDIEPSEQNLVSYDLSKKVINLLRHNQALQREEDGAIEFYRIKFYLRGHHSQIHNWSDNRWKACLAAGGGSKRRYQYCSDHPGTILYLHALQGHSGSNLIDPTLQDNVVIETGIFNYIYHIGCAFNLHSIINNGLIPGGQDLSRRPTVFFLPTDPRNESHKDPERIDFSVPRLARYMHSAWKRHQDAVFWVDIDLAISEGLTFYQTRSNAIILQGTLPAHYISKVERLKTGEMLYERRYLSPRPPPKISLRHDHNWTKGNDQSGSTVEHQPVGKLVQQSFGEAPRAESSKPTQSKPNRICDRTGKPVETEHVFVEKGKTSHSQEIVGKRLQEELGSSDRTGKPVKCEDNRVMKDHDRTGKPVEASSHKVQEVGSLEHRDTASSNANKFNLTIDEENIDFNISGVPNAMVKRSHGINVHNLIQQIENHPQRLALQSDLQQHRPFNPFSKESQDVIKAAGNTELCEILDVEPKAQCKACLAYWDAGIVYCTCGHFLRDDTTENNRYIKSVLDLFSIPELLHQEGPATRS